jgi:hypothetical protein
LSVRLHRIGATYADACGGSLVELRIFSESDGGHRLLSAGRQDRNLRPRREPELVQDVFDVLGRGCLGEDELGSDLTVRESTRD